MVIEWSGWPHGSWMWVFWLAALLVLARMLVRWFRISNMAGKGRNLPEEILKLRYRRGEIDKEEYERRLARLNELRMHGRQQNATGKHP